MKIKILKYLFLKPVTLASIKDAHHSLNFSQPQDCKKMTQECDLPVYFCISIEFLFINPCIYTQTYIWLHMSFPCIITVLLFRLSTHGKKFQTSDFCHFLIMRKKNLLSCGNKTVIALY